MAKKKSRTRRQPVDDLLYAHVWMRATAKRHGEWDAPNGPGKADPADGDGPTTGDRPAALPSTPPRSR